MACRLVGTTIIWTIAGLLLIGSSGTNVNENSFEIHIFNWIKCIWKCRLEIGVHFGCVEAVTICWNGRCVILDSPSSEIILCMYPANERRRYNGTSFLISCANAQNDPCISVQYIPRNVHSAIHLLVLVVVRHRPSLLMSFWWLFDSLTPGICGSNHESVTFGLNFSNLYLKDFLWNCSQENATEPHWWWVNIGSGNGLAL